MFYAHSTDDSDRGNWQPLAEHLANVSKEAMKRSAAFGSERLGALTGLLHDLGKYATAFQAYIGGSGNSIDHATAGAKEVLRMATERGDLLAVDLAAYAIAGHHTGLPDRSGENGSLDDRLKKQLKLIDEVWRTEIAPDAFQLFPQRFILHPDPDRRAFQFSMLGRMNFSCLVDSDYIDTEQFYDAIKNRTSDRAWAVLPEIIDCLVSRFDKHMAVLRGGTEPSPLNVLRADILTHARGKAARAPGILTLNVPTGGGKTLASLGFALDHARLHGLRRIVYCIPFTSIIDQTASIFRKALGDDFVLEHHSAIEEESPKNREGRDKLRLAMEDWAAPIVVTTNVQFFESLFAYRTSRCRKLHNIANSVIILDEAQTIPLHVLRPCVAALDELARNYGCTIVLCTATQPALSAPRFKGGLIFDEDSELAPDPPRLHRILKRATPALRGELTDDALIEELRAWVQGLVIVNSRPHALKLYGAARAAGLDGLVHLSTRQTAADRRRILADVRQKLEREQPCRVIATSLIEAGVDVDFPRAWRAEAGLDQLMQAAGRVNREGKKSADESVVVIFKPADAKPPSEIKGFIDSMERILKNHGDDLFSPQAIEAYFQEVYWSKGEKGLDRIRIKNADGLTIDAQTLRQFTMGAGRTDFAYRTVGEAFRLIESGMEPVIIAIEEKAKQVIEGLRGGWVTPGAAARELQTFIVQVSPCDRTKLIHNGHVAFLEGFGDQFAVLRTESFYTQETGLRWEEADELGFDGIL